MKEKPSDNGTNPPSVYVDDLDVFVTIMVLEELRLTLMSGKGTASQSRRRVTDSNPRRKKRRVVKRRGVGERRTELKEM